MYSKEVLVNEINGIINSDTISRSYDGLYLASLSVDTRYVSIIILC